MYEHVGENVHSFEISLFYLQALVDAPDMVRGQMNFKRLTLTDIKIDIKRVPNKKTLIAALDAAGRLNCNLVMVLGILVSGIMTMFFLFVCRC